MFQIKKIRPVDINEDIGRIVFKMHESKMEGMPVFSDHYEGMVYLKDIVVRNLDISTKVRVFIKKVPKLTDGENQIYDLANRGFKDYDVLPFFVNNDYIGVVSLLDYLSSLDLKIDLDKVAIEARIIDQNETIGVARNILNKEEVFLVSDKNEIVGAVNCFSLARIISTKRDRILTPDKIEEDEIKIKDFAEDFVKIEEKIGKDELIELLRENKYVVYKNKIITPKTIFRNLIKFEEYMKPEFSGFELTEGIYTEVIYKELNNFAKKVQKIIKPEKIKFHLKKLKKTGKTLYELNGRIIAGGRIISANVTGYGLLDLVQELIDKLEVQIIKAKH
ncbi:MAG: hypothetical protein DRP14_00970 [Candidatus Aenigmatarchaeota archaeon]|nr:MAG: hypothetical protein DRP14_00970 [Candidatus Aenigmarchaeota archaeon]